MGVEGLSKIGKELMDTDNSVVIGERVGELGMRGINGNGKNIIKIKY